MAGEKYEYGIDFERVAAIDIHTHVEVDGHGHKAYDDELVDAVGRYFKRGPGALSSVDELADDYRRHNAAAVVFTVDAERACVTCRTRSMTSSPARCETTTC